MPNLPEVDQFDAGVYQIEVADDVIGGVNGISNMQGKALANRTKHLNEHSLKDDTTPIGNYTIGDLFYAAGARLLAKLGIGTSGKVLTSTGSAPQWSDTLSLVGLTTGKIRSDSGATVVAAATPTTIFGAASGSAYIIYAYVDNSGAGFQAFAVVTQDSGPAAAVVLKEAWNGADLTITVAGANVEVTCSGAVTVNWRAVRIAV